MVNDSDSDSVTGKRSTGIGGANGGSSTQTNAANESNKSSIISNWIQQSNVVLSHPNDQLGSRFTMPDMRQPPPPVQNKQEREKERNKRGLPPIRDNHVSSKSNDYIYFHSIFIIFDFIKYVVRLFGWDI